MTRLLYRSYIFIASVLLLMPGSTIAQAEFKTYATDENPPIAQPLVREGDFAVKLAEALKLGTAANEAEAENVLSSVGIEPRNGWIADYPVTPDIIGELQTSISEAANAGRLGMGKDAALKAAQDVTAGYNLSIKTDAMAQQGSTAPATNYPETPVINNYYYDEGPPVVTYYAPPPDYAYMYTWVPYPFWWWNFWYPGYFVLADFHVRVHGHGGHEVFVSNHFRDIRTGGISWIDPVTRSRRGIAPARQGAGLSSPAARGGAQSILRGSQGRVSTGTTNVYRGYGERPSSGTRPSAFDRSRNSRFERAASDRGFQSRSNAGRINDGGRSTRGASPSVPRRDVIKRGPDSDGGGFHGRGGR